MLAASSVTNIRPMAGGDYEDIWCETGSVCSETLSSYRSRTKGNAAYGNQNGAIGAYDVIVTTNLNGRQAQWTVRLIWDSGPGLKFYSPTVHCRQKSFWGTINCGDHQTSYNPYITWAGSGYNYLSNILYGNRLVNGAEYYGQFNTQFQPDGYPMYIAGVLNTRVFNCPSSSGANCTFP